MLAGMMVVGVIAEMAVNGDGTDNRDGGDGSNGR
jgi:hypothetical protein